MRLMSCSASSSSLAAKRHFVLVDLLRGQAGRARRASCLRASPSRCSRSPRASDPGSAPRRWRCSGSSPGSLTLATPWTVSGMPPLENAPVTFTATVNMLRSITSTFSTNGRRTARPPRTKRIGDRLAVGELAGGAAEDQRLVRRGDPQELLEHQIERDHDHEDRSARRPRSMPVIAPPSRLAEPWSKLRPCRHRRRVRSPAAPAATAAGSSRAYR